jgi:hypothetical protein
MTSKSDEKNYFLFILLLTPIILFATIDECKTDIYFVNKVLANYT